MKDLNWNEISYTDVEVVDLKAHDGMESRAKSVRILNPNTMEFVEQGVVSSDYLLVNNDKLNDIVDNITGKLHLESAQNKTFFDGRKFVTSRIFPDIAKEFNVGDTVRMGLMAKSSYDGSIRAEIALFAEILACSNGMLSRRHLRHYSFKHQKGNINWEEEVNNIFHSLGSIMNNELDTFSNKLTQLSNYEINTKGELALIRNKGLNHLPDSLWGKVVDRFINEEPATAMGILDATTNILWHKENISFAHFGYNQKSVDGIIDTVLQLN